MTFVRPLAVASILAAALVGSRAMAEDKVSNPAILKQLAKAVDEMASPGGPGGVLDVVESGDRKRVVDDFKKTDLPEHRKLAEDLQKAWKKHYDTDFKMSEHLNIIEGNKVERFTHDGKEYATVDFPQFGSDSPFEIRLLKDKKSGEWHVLLNPRLEGERFAKRVDYALRDVMAKEQYWPKEEKSATAVVMRRLLDTLDYDPRKERESAKADADAKRK